MTQNEAVLALLRVRGDVGLTALEAFAAIGTMRLAARISDLRADGHDIRAEIVTVAAGTRVARYTFHEPAPVSDQLALAL